MPVTKCPAHTYYQKSNSIAMKSFLMLLSILCSFAVAAQNNSTFSDPNARIRTLNGSFTSISISDGIELFLTSGTEESVAVSFSDEKFDEKFKTEVENGVLKIYYDNKSVNWSSNKKRELKAYVSFVTLEKLSASGGSSVKLPLALTVSNLEMKFTSGSVFNGELKAGNLTIDQNSGSVVNLAGSADKLNIDVSSGANFKGYDFKTGYCDAKASSGAGIRITVEKELNAKANSGGGIHYKGTAVIKDVNVNSGGVVKKAK
jgi:hypothetical protein